MTDNVTTNGGIPLGCRDVRHAFGGRQVLDGITLCVPRGSVLGLIGRNGAGKSTLIRLLLGLMRPAGGRCELFGRDSLELADESKQRLAYVPQQPAAFQWMKVGAMLDFVGGFYPRWDGDYVDRSLARASIRKDARVYDLSPGERQSVALIRALAAQPELLILDEPAAALDPEARRELMREMAQRAGESGATVLFSTHIVTDLERIASHVALLHRGRLLINAPMDDLKETYARVILPPEAATRPQMAGELCRRTQSDGSVALVVIRDDAERRPDAEGWPHGAGGPTGRTVERLGLEDLFVEVVQ